MATVEPANRKRPSAGRLFIELNEAVCDRIEERLPGAFTRSLHRAHVAAIVSEISRRTPTARILDVGGGQNAPFIDNLPKCARPTIIALDISESQICKNKTIDCGIVADACNGFPIADGCIDVAVTRWLLEHLPNPRITVTEIARVLRPNGVCIHLFPSRFSPFALLNQLIPSSLGRRVLFAIFPEWIHTSGFRAFYRDCDIRRMRRLHEAAGLRISRLECRYYEAIYYKFFVPLYVAMVLFDYIAHLSGFWFVASQVLLIADKPSMSIAAATRFERAEPGTTTARERCPRV
jgi:SAM-dependent methyltransferase